MDLKERVACFYTRKGVIGKTALELGLGQIAYLDEDIKRCESEGVFEPEIYKLRTNILEGLYNAMDTQYREFYELTNGILREEVKQFHHDVVTQMTEELIERKKQAHEARRKYGG
jgi:hypothetical protein